MIGMPLGTRVWIAAGVTDLRKGMDGLAALVETALGERPFSGDVFAFRGKRGDHPGQLGVSPQFAVPRARCVVPMRPAEAPRRSGAVCEDCGDYCLRRRAAASPERPRPSSARVAGSGTPCGVKADPLAAPSRRAVTVPTAS